ncbi:MBL fold metallo-hydrolase [Telmatospirillum siberiense]|nr:ribonuclease J [Telmatospirillum siberiense]
MTHVDRREAGLYWQSRMGNNADGIGGNAHRYDVVAEEADGSISSRHFLVDYGLKLGGGRGYSCEFPSPEGVFVRRGESAPDGGGGPPEALLLTHAHEDHLGAVRHAIDMGYSCPPVYATAFTAAMLNNSLVKAGIARDLWPEIHIVRGGDVAEIGSAKVEFVPMDHMPGATALRIRTKEASVFHTGDYKFDETLALGERADPHRLRAIGAEGVDMVVSDSTSVATNGAPASEAEICRNLTRIVGDSRGRAVVAGILGSQLDRLVSLGRAAHANGRVLAVCGRSLADNVAAAQAAGLDIEGAAGTRILTSREARDLPPETVLMVTTGAFAQSNAGLMRSAHRQPGALPIDENTTVVIPQRAIPSVKTAHASMVAKLEERGAKVVTAERAPELGYGPIHQSGHAVERDAKLLYTLLKPRKIVAPIHGDGKQVEANGRLARSLGIPSLMLERNGAVVHIGASGASVVGVEEVSRIGARESEAVVKQLPRAPRGQGRNNRAPPAVFVYDRLDGSGRIVQHANLPAPEVSTRPKAPDGPQTVYAGARLHVQTSR